MRRRQVDTIEGSPLATLERPELVKLPDTESQQGIAATVEKYPPQIADDLNLDWLAKNASDSSK